MTPCLWSTQVKVLLAGKELKHARQKTAVHKKTLNPVFKEMLTFTFSKKEPLVHTVSGV